MASSTEGLPVSGAAERHQRHLERFLVEGRLVALTPRYAVVERPASWLRDGDEALRAIGCLACGSLSWNVNDVAAHYCSCCKVFHDDG
jgi:hypothetical protein